MVKKIKKLPLEYDLYNSDNVSDDIDIDFFADDPEKEYDSVPDWEKV